MVNYIGRYRVLTPIGQGGMGEVFKAQSPEGDIVAIKRILIHIVHQQEVLARFEREQRVQQQLQHPNLIPVIDVGEDQGMPFYVMPYIAGSSLSQRLRMGRPLSMKQTLVVVRHVGAALAYAHQSGVLHRDIKPGNILLHPDGQAYLMDFGIATDPNPDSSPLTRTEFVAGMGSLKYMAPEVAAGQRATIQADVYGFGATIYEMLTGINFKDAQIAGRGVWDKLAPALQPVLMQATQIGLSQRYTDVPSLVNAFERAVKPDLPTQKFNFTVESSPSTIPSISSTPSPAITPPPRQLPPSRNPNRIPIIGLSVIFILITLLLIGVLLPNVYSNPLPTSTSSESATTGNIWLEGTTRYINHSGVKLTVNVLKSNPDDIAIPLNQQVEVQKHPLQNISFWPTDGSDPTYYYVQNLATGEAGWVEARYLSEYPVGTETEEPASNTPTPSVNWEIGTMLTINVEKAWLRPNPDSDAVEGYDVLNQGTSVTATGEYQHDGKQGWWQVKAVVNGEAKIGWIEQGSLHPASQSIIPTTITPMVTLVPNVVIQRTQDALNIAQTQVSGTATRIAIAVQATTQASLIQTQTVIVQTEIAGDIWPQGTTRYINYSGVKLAVNVLESSPDNIAIPLNQQVEVQKHPSQNISFWPTDGSEPTHYYVQNLATGEAGWVETRYLSEYPVGTETEEPELNTPSVNWKMGTILIIQVNTFAN